MNVQMEITSGHIVQETDTDPRRWLALAVLLTGAFLPFLDFNVVNLALPTIRESLGASSSEVQFVISAYAATYAVFLITGGRLGDLFGRKRFFMTGVAGFTLASVVCSVAWSPSILILGRILQGLTATMMTPQILASIRVLFPAAEQSRALGLYGATFGFANISGQILGGVLVSSQPFGLTWQAIFLINVPIGCAAFIGSVFYLRDSRSSHAQKLDFGGIALLSLTLGLLVYPLVEGRETGWPMWILAMLILCPIVLIAFIRFEAKISARGGDPLVELSLFRDGAFVIGVIIALAFYMLSSFYLTFSVYLQGGLHLTALEAGLATLPFAGGFFAGSLVSSRVMQALGTRALALGFALQVLGFGGVIIAVSLPRFAWGMDFGLFCAGLGFGMVLPSIIKAVIGGVDQRHAGLVSGLMISTFQVGAALGIAIIGGIFYTALGSGQNIASYQYAFSVALGCNVFLLVLCGVLSLWLANTGSSNADDPVPMEG
ncbi:MFS transporter [Phyllobacterium myrsinacearum]|uniref:EmrB/QacA subfamily drug resistance transporter n=1 Tax=Phyllobacterium myrsinacearum TaxID=28101 RepID=A0A839EPI3_9HYPH|nr:MFS transporter [Phyllobacterium myrsinacearum]MBA8879404.1 EmrB/QacA subfamily drug resistance transporter [Phyllobacterium myrsinacearum]